MSRDGCVLCGLGFRGRLPSSRPACTEIICQLASLPVSPLLLIEAKNKGEDGGEGKPAKKRKEAMRPEKLRPKIEGLIETLSRPITAPELVDVRALFVASDKPSEFRDDLVKKLSERGENALDGLDALEPQVLATLEARQASAWAALEAIPELAEQRRNRAIAEVDRALSDAAAVQRTGALAKGILSRRGLAALVRRYEPASSLQMHTDRNRLATEEKRIQQQDKLYAIFDAKLGAKPIYEAALGIQGARLAALSVPSLLGMLQGDGSANLEAINPQVGGLIALPDAATRIAERIAAGGGDARADIITTMLRTPELSQGILEGARSLALARAKEAFEAFKKKWNDKITAIVTTAVEELLADPKAPAELNVDNLNIVIPDEEPAELYDSVATESGVTFLTMLAEDLYAKRYAASRGLAAPAPPQPKEDVQMTDAKPKVGTRAEYTRIVDAILADMLVAQPAPIMDMAIEAAGTETRQRGAVTETVLSERNASDFLEGYVDSDDLVERIAQQTLLSPDIVGSVIKEKRTEILDRLLRAVDQEYRKRAAELKQLDQARTTEERERKRAAEEEARIKRQTDKQARKAARAAERAETERKRKEDKAAREKEGQARTEDARFSMGQWSPDNVDLVIRDEIAMSAAGITTLPSSDLMVSRRDVVRAYIRKRDEVLDYPTFLQELREKYPPSPVLGDLMHRMAWALLEMSGSAILRRDSLASESVHPKIQTSTELAVNGVLPSQVENRTAVKALDKQLSERIDKKKRPEQERILQEAIDTRIPEVAGRTTDEILRNAAKRATEEAPLAYNRALTEAEFRGDTLEKRRAVLLEEVTRIVAQHYRNMLADLGASDMDRARGFKELKERIVRMSQVLDSIKGGKRPRSDLIRDARQGSVTLQGYITNVLRPWLAPASEASSLAGETSSYPSYIMEAPLGKQAIGLAEEIYRQSREKFGSLDGERLLKDADTAAPGGILDDDEDYDEDEDEDFDPTKKEEDEEEAPVDKKNNNKRPQDKYEADDFIEEGGFEDKIDVDKVTSVPVFDERRAIELDYQRRVNKAKREGLPIPPPPIIEELSSELPRPAAAPTTSSTGVVRKRIVPTLVPTPMNTTSPLLNA